MNFSAFVLGNISLIGMVIGGLLAFGVAFLRLVRSKAFLALAHRRTKLGYAVSICCLSLGIILLLSCLILMTRQEGKLLNKTNLILLVAVTIWFVAMTGIMYFAVLRNYR